MIQERERYVAEAAVYSHDRFQQEEVREARVACSAQGD